MPVKLCTQIQKHPVDQNRQTQILNTFQSANHFFTSFSFLWVMFPSQHFSTFSGPLTQSETFEDTITKKLFGKSSHFPRDIPQRPKIRIHDDNANNVHRKHSSHGSLVATTSRTRTSFRLLRYQLSCAEKQPPRPTHPATPTKKESNEIEWHYWRLPLRCALERYPHTCRFFPPSLRILDGNQHSSSSPSLLSCRSHP